MKPVGLPSSSNASRVGALDAINDVETARKRLDKVAARIRYADRGYGGFFDAVKISDAVLDAIRAHPLGRNAAIVGECVVDRPGFVVLDTGFGSRLLAEAEGELLPRIC